MGFPCAVFFGFECEPARASAWPVAGGFAGAEKSGVIFFEVMNQANMVTVHCPPAAIAATSPLASLPAVLAGGGDPADIFYAVFFA